MLLITTEFILYSFQTFDRLWARLDAPKNHLYLHHFSLNNVSSSTSVPGGRILLKLKSPWICRVLSKSVDIPPPSLLYLYSYISIFTSLYPSLYLSISLYLYLYISISISIFTSLSSHFSRLPLPTQVNDHLKDRSENWRKIQTIRNIYRRRERYRTEINHSRLRERQDYEKDKTTRKTRLRERQDYEKDKTTRKTRLRERQDCEKDKTTRKTILKYRTQVVGKEEDHAQVSQVVEEEDHSQVSQVIEEEDHSQVSQAIEI